MSALDEMQRSGFLVHDVSRLRRTVFDQRVRPLGITRSQWWVLMHLMQPDGADLMQIELARRLDLGKVTLGGLLGRLEQRGLIVRTPDRLDRRSKRVCVSRKGRALMKRLRTLAAAMNEEVLRGIPAAKRRELDAMLAQMKRNLIAMDAVPGARARRSPG